MGRVGVEPFLNALFLIVSLPVGYIVWCLLRQLALRYRTKRYSDRQLLVDAWWLVVTLCIVVRASSGHIGVSVAFGLLAFTVYRVAVGVGLRFARLDNEHQRVECLLLLRVFGHQRRTDQLFDAIAQRW